MSSLRRSLIRAAEWTAIGFGLAAVGYATLAGAAWLRYGRLSPARDDEADPLLDEVMPDYEIAERHHILVKAPARLTLDTAVTAELDRSSVIRAIFRSRELALGATATSRPGPRGLLPDTLAMGWRVIAEAAGRELVVGAVTKPWQADVTFRGLDREAFRTFREPDYVKIAWTLRADPRGDDASVLRTETRVLATDRVARRRFRRYWARFSPGILLIRRLLLRQIKRDAERQAARAFGSGRP